MIYLDMSLIDAKKIITQASNRIASDKNHTALELLQIRLQQNFYLSTGLKDLDVAMRGGIDIGTISEICGAPGVGKTQLCIGCCVQAVVMNHSNSSGLKKKGGVIYVDTELKFDSMRLTEVAAHCYPHIYNAGTIIFKLNSFLLIFALSGRRNCSTFILLSLLMLDYFELPLATLLFLLSLLFFLYNAEASMDAPHQIDR
jgi:RecA/RadA recombinase